MKRLLGYTWMGWLNILILQWFFIRLAREVDDTGKTTKYKILKWIIPCTGWFSHYIWLNRR